MPILNRPLRVMHIISGDLWAGAEVQAYTLLKHLQAEVELCVILMNQGELSEKLTALGITPIIIPETTHSSFSIIRKLSTHIRRFKPDVIHTHRQKENILGSLANLLAVPFQRKLTPSIRTAHGAPEFTPKGKQKIQVWLDQFTARWLQRKIIAVSDDLSTKLESLFPRKHLVVIPNGVDEENLKQLATIADFRKSAPNSTHIGIIGRLEAVKRVDIFLEMAAILVRDQPQTAWQFHVIGDGKLRKNLEHLAKELGISSQVCFHGHRGDISSCIASLNVIIMCSDHEGTPMTALEALALGKPLIAHDVGGLREILFDYPQLRVTEHKANAYANRVVSCLSVVSDSLVLRKIYHAETNARTTIETYLSISH